MDKLVYKNYVWPQNPDHYRQTCVREPVYGKNSANETVFMGMGPLQRTITGSGVFVGATAYHDFKELVKVFEESTYGGLIHPVWGTFRCFFTELQLTQEPRADYVAYTFEFRDSDSDGGITQ